MITNKNQSDIKFGQVWKATRDVRINIYSPQNGCVIPKNTRIVVLNDPVEGAIAFDIMPLSSKGLDEKLIPNLKKMETEKEGFGVPVNIGYFKRCFVLDKNQKIEFDNTDSEIFWKIITAHRH